MLRENELKRSDAEREKLKIRIEKTLQSLRMLGPRMREEHVEKIEVLYAQIDEELDVRDTGSSWRSWYPMSGTTESTKKDLE